MREDANSLGGSYDKHEHDRELLRPARDADIVATIYKFYLQ